MKVVLRPGRSTNSASIHPITYDAIGASRGTSSSTARDIPCRCRCHQPQWKAYRFVTNTTCLSDRGSWALLLETKYTDVQATLSNILIEEFVSAKAPIPTIGASDVYVVPISSITGEERAWRTEASRR